MTAPGWPATLTHGRLVLRPIRRLDGRAWAEVRRRNRAWLAPWEATAPRGAPAGPTTFTGMAARLRAEARHGGCLPFVIGWDGRLVGQMTVGGVTGGSLLSGHVGYWLDADVAGRGITPTALALVTDHCFRSVGLHRVEVNIRPENAPSLRVVEKLGFRDEGVRERLLHIDGAWRDHRSFALCVDDVGPGGVLGRLAPEHRAR